MPDGGFLVKIDGKEICRCYAIAFDYDDWKYTVNDTEAHEMPDLAKSISIEIES
jgi:hypothetical protein